MVAPGGHLAIDIYLKDGQVDWWKSKYLWRWLTTRIAPERLLNFLEWFIPKWLPIDSFIKRIPFAGKYLGAIIPCWNFTFSGLSPDQQRVGLFWIHSTRSHCADNPARLSEVKE
ncbi:MAG: hypothetical protein WDN48_06690 [Pseudolabrys sp.]